jgi:hypothetical protein
MVTDLGTGSDYFKPSTPDDLENTARNLGMVVHYPDNNALFVDLDSPATLNEFYKRFAVLKAAEPDAWVNVKQSKSPGHFHAVVGLPRRVKQWERIALQAALGSDPKRELLACLKRTETGGPGPTCFFEVPE